MGVLGVFLPVFPTMPFLLLAAYCYLRGSQRLYQRLINHRVFGAYLRNYIRYHAVSRAAKIGSMVAMWASLSISIAVIGSLPVRLILAAVGVSVSIHLLSLKTLPKGAAKGSVCGKEDLPEDDR